MKGNPKFKEGDKVSFRIDDITLKGEIYIVDKWGTLDNPSDVSYDIMVLNSKHKVKVGYCDTEFEEVKEVEGPCLYKHITESLVYEEDDK